MMTQEELKQKCLDVHILSYRNNSIKLSPHWIKSVYPKLEDSFKEELDLYISKFRTSQEAFFCLKNDIKEIPKCEICGAPVKFHRKHYGIVCENHNANQVESKKARCLESFNKNNDWEDIKRKARQTRLQKYGDANYSLFGSKSFKKNLKDKYGDEHYNNHEKARQTCLEKYGVTCNLSVGISERSQKMWDEKHDEIVRKSRATVLSRYGKDFRKELANSTWARRKMFEEKFETNNNCTARHKLIEKYGQGWLTLHLKKTYNRGIAFISNDDISKIENYVPSTYQEYVISKPETEIYEYVCSLIGKENVVRSSRKVIKMSNKNAELDIYVPSHHIAIEYNGIYWHSDKWKDKDYHINKTVACETNELRLIHIFQDEWENDKEKIKSLIKDSLQIYDHYIDFDDCTLTRKDFKYSICRDNDEICSITLDKKNNIVQIYVKEGYFVKDGLKNLIRHMSLQTKEDIHINIDRSKYNREYFELIGFKFLNYTRPNIFYVDKEMKRHHKMTECLKQQLYHTLYDSGKIKMVYKYE